MLTNYLCILFISMVSAAVSFPRFVVPGGLFNPLWVDSSHYNKLYVIKVSVFTKIGKRKTSTGYANTRFYSFDTFSKSV